MAANCVPPDEAQRLGGHAGVQRDDVALAQQRVERHVPDAVARVRRRQLNIRIGDQNPAAERLQEADDLRPDVAIADHADRRLRKLAPDQVGSIEVAAPDAFAQRVVPAGDQASFRDDGADRELGDRRGVAPRRIDHEDPALAGGGKIDVDRPATRHGDEAELRHALEHRSGKRRELGDRDLGVADEADDRFGVALIFLEAIHAGLDIAVAHRLIRPRQFHGFDVQLPSAPGADRRLEGERRHEAIADDGDPRSPRPAHAAPVPARLVSTRFRNPDLHRARLPIRPEIIGNRGQRQRRRAAAAWSNRARLRVAGDEALRAALRGSSRRRTDRRAISPRSGPRAAARTSAPARRDCPPLRRSRSAGRASARRARRPSARSDARKGAPAGIGRFSATTSPSLHVRWIVA